MKPEISAANQLFDEEKLIVRAKADPSQFRPLYDAHYSAIFSFVLRRIGEKSLTADLTSQVFLKALVNLSSYTYKGLPFSAWLYRIAINEVNSFFRRSKRERFVVLGDDVAENLYDEIVDPVTSDSKKESLAAALEKLKADELQVIELRYLEGRPFKEVACILGITENYAKVRTYRILTKMRKSMTRHD